MKRNARSLQHLTFFVVLIVGLLIISCSFPLFQIGTDSEEIKTNPSAGDDVSSQNGSEQNAVSELSSEPEVSQPELGSTVRWIDSSLLVYIPPGEFTMGHDGEDNPEHSVFLDGFWIYRTEVTNRMYLNCMAMGKCSPPAVDPAIPDLEDPALADFPVVGVRWYQAVEYCEFVDGSLPTEAQWEKTARGTDARLYPWGDDEPSCELLNFDDCVEDISPVDQYPLGASPYDVLDMAGNVFEWVYDWYREEYYAESPFENPMGPESGEARSVRGSTYRSTLDQIESSLRYFLEPEEYRVDLGFRCVVGNAEFYAPPCEILAHDPEDGVGDNPDDPPGGSAACIVPEPQIAVVTYCEKGDRGNNISWSPADADINYSTSEGVGCSMYDADTLACRGNYGATVNVEVCKSCPPPVVELGIIAECDPPYVLDDVTNLCKYDGPPIPGRVRCAPGYSISGDDSCCVREEGTPFDFPVCPVGGVYDASSKICWFTLPSTGDQKCVEESVFFRWCPPENTDDKPEDPCAKYTINECGTPVGCIWDYDAGVCREP